MQRIGATSLLDEGTILPAQAADEMPSLSRYASRGMLVIKH